MILYNTLMGVAAGLALILVPLLVRKLNARKPIAPEGWAVSLGTLGLLLAVLGGVMSTTWPLTANPPINIMFGEPSMFLGVLLLAAALFLWSRRELIAQISGPNKKASDEAYAYITRVLAPVSWVLFGLGMLLFACSLAVFRFGFVGGAPAAEPITGLLHDKPFIENTFFGAIYLLPALGLLAMPWAARNFGSKLARFALMLLTIAGVAFLLFSALNYYTHIGLLVNLLEGKNFKF